ncbi:ESPR-type extended signal peptide-containing protein, partial [Serratia fonticola]|uniref:ESPR-type extended signal peptide-containing protein n=2 Tax=Serratia fonticola TaxID=47917 RepID=UPI0021BD86F4
MNKIYRLVWNASQRAWVVAGEFATAHGKGKNSPRKLASTAAGLVGALALSMTPVEDARAYVAGGGTATLSNAVAIGTGASVTAPVSGGGGGVAIGYNTTVTDTDGVAFGTSSTAGKTAFAAGFDSRAEGESSVSIGTHAIASGKSSTAIGKQTIASGAGSVAVGNQSEATGIASSAFGDYGHAIGDFSSSFGYGSYANKDYSIVFGSNSTADGVDATAIGHLANAAAKDSIAFGHNAQATQLSGVAIGLDASSTGLVATAIGPQTKASGSSAVALGSRSDASGADSVAIGNTAKSSASNSMAIGTAANVTVAGGIALGSSSNATRAAGSAGYLPVGISDSAKAAIEATVAARGAVDIGSRQITSVAAGTANSDAVNVAQLKSVEELANSGWNVTDGTTTANIGPSGSVTFKGDGNMTVTQTGADDVGVVNVQLNKNIDLSSTGSLKIGNSQLNDSGLTITGGPSVTTAGINAAGKKVTNVAAGDISTTSTDAINGSQLKDVVDSGLTFAGNTGSTVKALGSTVTVKGGKTTAGSYSDANLNTVVDAAGNLNVQMADNPVFNSAIIGGNTTLNNTGLTITGGPSVTTAGINAAGNKVTNVAAGVDDTDAVNVSQLKNLDFSPITFAGNTGSVAKALGSTMTVKGGKATA